MEPDIRIYSSSPPPLDNGAEEDDDDEFGGFSGVTSSGVAFTDFDTPSYTNSKEEFLPSNHFMPIYDYSDSVESFTNFTAANTVKDKDHFAEIPDSTRGHSSLLETNTSNEKIRTRTSLAGGVQIVEQKEDIVKQDTFSPEVVKMNVNISRDQEIGRCNGDKIPCLETLTNGFTVLEMVNPQGTEDINSFADSKELKTVSTHTTELSLDSSLSPVDDFADFSTFSNKDHIQLTETEQRTQKGLDKGELRSTQDNNILNTVALLSSLKQVPDEDQVGVVDDCSWTSEGNEGVANHEHVYVRSTMHSPTWRSLKAAQSTKCKEHYTVETTLRQTDQEPDSFKTPDSSKTAVDDVGLRKIQVTNKEAADKNGLDNFGVIMSNGVRSGFASSGGSNDDDFGDFGAVDSTNLPVSKNISGPCSNVIFSEPGDEFGDFGNTSNAFHQSECKQILDSNAEPPGANSDSEGKSVSDAVNEDDHGFTEFDSVPEKQEGCSCFQDSEDFADFSVASCNQGAEWNAFEDDQKETLPWAAFQDEQTDDSSHEREVWHSHQIDGVVASEGEQASGAGMAALSAAPETENIGCIQDSAPTFQSSLIGRLERIFLICFPAVPVSEAEDKLTSLRQLLETKDKEAKPEEITANTGELFHVWTELQDIHDSHGLRYQWGGSHSNKKLLCSLGIDTRNILFTGNKKQPVIVPMYAAGLGMLEPTKEPLKPVSAAEKIASIGQTPSVSPDMSTCTADQFQDTIPPVQFDWSSSGLTNPLDGVDPELYELTTSKLETSSGSSKVTDAFARLMSTVEKTSTSTRKPRKEEHLSEEAARVIASLPDLSFMHAKVLMFPATLTPAATCQEKLE
ncbi:aftiphilin isoform X2 [Microcaecilia unicolor]|uniref:Aftiphilin isoform X2 n=1 Tax=Microcaecilia unicolor TaxID=1415580 RepID=A0A6P7X8S8_9AMPH|nr:aftiphilin isoform X2 [Microcaecilia unicolor]